MSLQESGFAVIEADSGTAAIAHLQGQHHVDIIVTDLTMPVMDGMAVIRLARDLLPGLPAILLTGYAEDDAALLIGGAVSGAFSLLRKPVSNAHLIERINALLAVPRPLLQG
jgi:CheY-like chemotaxis protein